MIYLIEDMNKRTLRTLYPVFMVLTGIILALLSALVAGASVSALSRPDLRFNSNTAAVLYQAATPTPAGAAVSRAGSTDGIMIMGVVIVIIVLVPILFRRSMWTK